MKLMLRPLVFIAMGIFGCLRADAADRTAGERPRMNVLFIAIDDLRPELGCYGQKHVRSPNIDRLAAEGIRFTRAYCQSPACGPSRSSLLSGIHPDARSVTRSNIDQFAPGVLTLPQAFREAGYYTISNSKIFHAPEHTAQRSWSQTPTGHDDHLDFVDPASKSLINPRSKRGPFSESPDVADAAYVDGRTCEKSLNDLRRLARMEPPFFLAVGLVRPHLPFYAPKKYADNYDENTITLAVNRGPIGNKPTQLISSGEFGAYHDRGIPYNGDAFHRAARHGYYACVSYADSLVGRLLDELDRLRLRDNTIVVLWGDHGWLLGEHGFWAKACLLDEALRVPLIFRVPGMNGDRTCQRTVELVDIYPTLLELAGIDKPKHLTGVSLVPLLKDPTASWKDTAFSWWRKGRSVRTSEFAYSEWIENDRVAGRMLFDRLKDPQENVNIADLPENAPLIERFQGMLEVGPKRRPSP